jgi:glycosyltransferase involved in cell wall biosynthesis
MVKRNQLRILQLIPEFGQGGAEKVFSQLGKELSKKYTVIDGVFNLVRKQEYTTGHQIVELGVMGGDNVIVKVYYFLLRILRLNRLKSTLEINLTISHLEGADYVNVLSKGKDKTILCIHGSKNYDQNIKGIIGWLRKNLLIPFLYNRADHVVAVSCGIKNELVNRYKVNQGRISVVPNFFDIEELCEKAVGKLPVEVYRLMESYDIIVTSGRLEAEKNQGFLISIMPELLKSRPSIKLILLGDGSLLPALVEKANQLGLSVQSLKKPIDKNNQIYFLGYQENPFPIIRHSKIFVMPSLWEGFPLALCEAMAIGTPVIAHDCPTGPREIIAPWLEDKSVLNKPLFTDCGVLIPKVDPKMWKETIIRLLDDDNLRKQISVMGQKRVQAFSKEKVMENWHSLIKKVIQ